MDTTHSTSVYKGFFIHFQPKKIIIGLTGILLVIPAMINAANDIYHSIANSAIGGQERLDRKLREKHFDETPLHRSDIEILAENDPTSMPKILRISVYENSDIFIRYEGKGRWLAGEPQFTSVSIPLISQAVAEDTYPKSPIILDGLDTRSFKIDLRTIKSQKNSVTNTSENSEIRQSYLFSKKYNNHKGLKSSARVFVEEFAAKPGFVITEHSVDIISQSKAGEPKVTLSADRKSLKVEVSLSSGPIYNQWSGWIKAEINTRQKRKS